MSAEFVSSSPPELIRAEGLRKTFGPNIVLEHVDLSVRQGEIVALLGSNGSGKTTLLKILASLLRPSRGVARVNGHDVAREVERVRSTVGLLAHGNYVYEDLTALENLWFWATLANVTVGREDLLALLRDVDLDAVADERVRTFSTGMKRRLSLARLRLRSPNVLLLDEPFAGLDQRGKKWLEELLLGLKARGGSVLMVTHSFGREVSIADRIVILAGGRIVLDRPSASMTAEEIQRVYTLHVESRA
jgi:heme ABC exporter ATP-binding subunit CcmA